MNSEEPSSENRPAAESALRREGVRLLRGCLWLIIIVLVLFLVLNILGSLGFLLEIPLRLGAGWAFHLQHTLPEIHWSAGMIVSSVIAVLAAAFSLNFVARQLCPMAPPAKPAWSWSATTGVTLGVAVLFGSAICGAGIVHQAGWLLRTDWITDGYSGRLFGPDTERARQLVVAAKSLSRQTSRLPEYLEELQYYVEEGDLRPQLVPKSINGEIPEPWIYLGSGLRNDAPDWMPVLAQPRPTKVRQQNMRVVLLFDGTSKAMNEEEYQALLSKWRAYRQETVSQP